MRAVYVERCDIWLSKPRTQARRAHREGRHSNGTGTASRALLVWTRVDVQHRKKPSCQL